MTKWKPTPGQSIRYWHPRNGGWYHGTLIKMGRKWATVQPWVPKNSRHHRVPVMNVERATWVAREGSHELVLNTE